MRALTVSAFRQNLKKHLDAVIDDQDIIIIPRDKADGDGDGIVVMSLARYNAYSETDRINDSPENRKWLLESIAEIEREDIVSIDLRDYED